MTPQTRFQVGWCRRLRTVPAIEDAAGIAAVGKLMAALQDAGVEFGEPDAETEAAIQYIAKSRGVPAWRVLAKSLDSLTRTLVLDHLDAVEKGKQLRHQADPTPAPHPSTKQPRHPSGKFRQSLFRKAETKPRLLGARFFG